jgi:ketosteroid isomerase-like protein
MTTATPVHTLYRALRAGDRQTAATVLHPAAVLHAPGRHPMAGDHIGREKILDFMYASGRATNHQDTTILDVLTGADHVAVYCRVTASAGQATLDNRTVHLFRIINDEVTECWFHNADQEHVDAFWSEALR